MKRFNTLKYYFTSSFDQYLSRWLQDLWWHTRMIFMSFHWVVYILIVLRGNWVLFKLKLVRSNILNKEVTTLNQIVCSIWFSYLKCRSDTNQIKQWICGHVNLCLKLNINLKEENTPKYSVTSSDFIKNYC